MNLQEYRIVSVVMCPHYNKAFILRKQGLQHCSIISSGFPKAAESGVWRLGQNTDNYTVYFKTKLY